MAAATEARGEESEVTMRAKARWRDPALGMRRELDLPQGRLRCFEAGSGPPIVFVHGGFVNANLWRKVVPRLAPDFHCVALDLPFGSHDLPMKPDADLSEQGVLDLIVRAIEALGLDDVTLVGMDTGGAICQLLVTQRPERIGKLVLTSCDYRDNAPPRIFFHVKLLPYLGPLVPLLFAPMRLRAMRRLPNTFGWLSNRQVERVVEDTWILPGLEDRRVRRDLNKFIRILDKRRLNEAADKLRTFERPALIAWSRDDRVFPPEHGERLARELPNARLEFVEGARTFSMEDQPERLAELIGNFVREPTKAAAAA
jgi:pimeloyl-ACP methyl ester carboxylesterase